MNSEEFKKLYICDLNNGINTEALKTHFSQWGHVKEVHEVPTKIFNRLCCIIYTDPYMVDNAQKVRPHSIYGSNIETKRGIQNKIVNIGERWASVKKIFVGALEPNTENHHLVKYFKKYGNVTSCNLVLDKETGKKRGFAFIEFDDYDPIDQICLEWTHKIMGKPVDIRKALTSEEYNIWKIKIDNS